MDELREAIEKLLQEKNCPILFLCGLGGCGKTTMGTQLAKEFASVAVHSDWWAKYSTTERKKRIQDAIDSGDTTRIEQEENPQNWYDMWEKLSADLLQLQQERVLTLHNAWNQNTGEKDLTVELSVPENGLIIFDGIYLLHPGIQEVADLIVFLDVPFDVCRERSEKRDGHRSDPEYLAYKATLAEKYDVPYFETYKNNADLIISKLS